MMLKGTHINLDKELEQAKGNMKINKTKSGHGIINISEGSRILIENMQKEVFDKITNQKLSTPEDKQ